MVNITCNTELQEQNLVDILMAFMLVMILWTDFNIKVTTHFHINLVVLPVVGCGAVCPLWLLPTLPQLRVEGRCVIAC